MKRRSKSDEQAPPASDRLVQLFESLPAERRGTFLEWLEREDAKAKRPKRGPGRPRHMDEPMSDSVTVKVPPAMRQEMRDVAAALGLRNEAEYLRRLHRALLAIQPSLAKRGAKSKGAQP